jgi:hypothetical protein
MANSIHYARSGKENWKIASENYERRQNLEDDHLAFNALYAIAADAIDDLRQNV